MKRSAQICLLIILLLSAFMVFPTPVQADEIVDTQPPVILVRMDKNVLTRTETQAAYFSAFDPEPSSGFLGVFGLFEGKPIQSGQNLTMLWLPLGTHTVQVSAYDMAGNVSSAEASFTVVATLDSLHATVVTLCDGGYITRASLCTAYKKKLTMLINLRDQGRLEEVRYLLKVLSKDVTAQSKKAINPPLYPTVADLLVADIAYVLEHL